MMCINNCKFHECDVEKTEHVTKWFDTLVCHTCGNGEIRHYDDSCCKTPDVIFVNMPRKDGAPLKRRFCKNCGYYKMVKMEWDTEWKSLPLVTVENADKIQDEVSNKRMSFFKYLQSLKLSIHEKRNEEFFEEYNEYLKTPSWRKIRQKVLERDNHTCQGCLENKATEVHHKTYEHVFDEFAFELVSLCSDCHRKYHDKL